MPDCQSRHYRTKHCGPIFHQRRCVTHVLSTRSLPDMPQHEGKLPTSSVLDNIVVAHLAVRCQVSRTPDRTEKADPPRPLQKKKVKKPKEKGSKHEASRMPSRWATNHPGRHGVVATHDDSTAGRLPPLVYAMSCLLVLRYNTAQLAWRVDPTEIELGWMWKMHFRNWMHGRGVS